MTSTRSLDLAAESIQEAVAWKEALHTLLIFMSSNTDWAIDQLHRKKPTWRHDSLDNPPLPTGRRKSLTAASPREMGSGADGRTTSRTSSSRSHASLKDQMFSATRAGDYDTLCSLLNTKISVNLMAGDLQDTPLMIACRYGMDDIARLCLNHGARNDPHPDFGQTALHCAVESKSFGCARVLLDAAAPSGSDRLIANLKDVNGSSSLHLACRTGDLRITKLLVGHGADISLRDQNFRTALHVSCFFGHQTLLCCLLDSGGDGYLELVDSDGRTALHYAAECGHLSCVKLLLETAANPIAQDSNRQTPYQVAYREGHERVCELLLEYQRHLPDGRHHRDSLSVFGSSDDPFDGVPTRGWVNRDPPLVASYSHPPLAAPSPLMRNISYPLPAPVSETAHPSSLPRPHTSRPSSATNGTPTSVHVSSPTAQLREKFRFSSSSPLASPRDRSAVRPGAVSASPEPSVSFKAHESPTLSSRKGRVNEMIDSEILPRPSSTPTSMKLFSSPVSGIAKKTAVTRAVESPSASTAAASSFNSLQSQADPDSDSVSLSLERFSLFGGQWDVYHTPEGGDAYYLEAHSQHSQWEDPRLHGILVYNEKTGAYVKCAKLPQYWALQAPPQRFTENNKEEPAFPLPQSSPRSSPPQSPDLVCVPSLDPQGVKGKGSNRLQEDEYVEELEDRATKPLMRTRELDQRPLFGQRSVSPELIPTEILSPPSIAPLVASPAVLDPPLDVGSQPEEESDPLLEEVFEEDVDRCESCSESGDLAGSFRSLQSYKNLEVSLASETDDEVGHGAQRQSKQRRHGEGRQGREDVDHLETDHLEEIGWSSRPLPKQARRPIHSSAYASSPTQDFLVRSGPVATESPLPTSDDLDEIHQPRLNANNDGISRRRDDLSGNFSYQGALEFGVDQPEESSEPLEGVISRSQYPTRSEPRDQRVDQPVSLEKERKREEEIPSLLIADRSTIRYGLGLGEQVGRSTATYPNPSLKIDLSLSSDDETIPSLVASRNSVPVPTPPLATSTDLSDWDESDAEPLPNRPSRQQPHGVALLNSRPPTDSNFEISEDLIATLRPLSPSPSSTSAEGEPFRRSLTAEELERQKIFSAELGGYGNGGSLFESNGVGARGQTDFTALATVRQVSDVLESHFPSLSHADLLVNAIQTLDRIGGKINSHNLSLLETALPSPDKLSEVLLCIRSPSDAHPYGPGELLCLSVASSYPLFLRKLKGFLLLTELTSALPAVLSRLRLMIEFCNEVSPPAPYPAHCPTAGSRQRPTEATLAATALSRSKDHSDRHHPSRPLLLAPERVAPKYCSWSGDPSLFSPSPPSSQTHSQRRKERRSLSSSHSSAPKSQRRHSSTPPPSPLSSPARTARGYRSPHLPCPSSEHSLSSWR
jgi:ankyrin repeat protein